jgi:hypothetical protein
LNYFALTPSTGAAATIVAAPLRATPASFLTTFFTTLARDPLVHATTVSAAVRTNTTGTLATESLLQTPASSWSSHDVATYATLIDQTRSFTSAITSSSIAESLRVNALGAAIIGRPDARQAAIARAQAALNTQAGQIRVDTSPITLTGSGTALPITLYSRAPYSITVMVHVLTDRLSFPHGAAIPVTLDAPTTSLRVPTGAHRGSSATVRVEVTTPDGTVLLARAALLVNVAGTSAVGWLLTAGSLLVVAAWWWRTARRRAAARRS